MHRRFLFLWLPLLAAACTRSAAQGEFVLRVAVVGPLAPIHPLLDTTSTTLAHDLVFEQILTPDEQGVLTSRVAQRWERIDGQRYRVQLDPGRCFSDGSPVRAEDVIASLAARKLQAAVRGEWIEVDSSSSGLPVEAALLYTLVFKQTPQGFLGTGPFRLVEQTEARIALERVKRVRGRVSRVELVSFPTLRDLFIGVLGGKANAAFALDARQLYMLEDLPALKPVRSVSPHAVTVVFNTARLDAETRRRLRAGLPIDALAHVFNRDNRDGDEPVHRSWAWPSEQNLPPSRRLEILVPHFTQGLYAVALGVRRSLGKRGGEVVHLDIDGLRAREQAGDFDIAIRPILAWPEAVKALSWHSRGFFNWPHYSNPRVDAAFARGDFAAAAAELEADPPFVEVCRRERFGVVDARIKNPRLGWWGVLDTLPEWEIEE